MTVLDTQPENFNFLNPANFKVVVKRCPNINWYTQKVQLPGITSEIVPVGTPFTNIHYPGDHINFPPLSFTFKVSESLEEWLEIFHWMIALGFPESWDQYKALLDEEKVRWDTHGLKSDISVIIQNGTLQPTHEFVYKDCFPSGLGGFDLATNLSDIEYTISEVNFTYTYFHVNRLPEATCPVV